jgi:hypothetical protein
MSVFQFISLLDLQEYTPAGQPVPDEWVVDQPLIALRSNGDKLIVPRGYITDLASIPRPLRAVFDINGLMRAPAVLHDWLYSSQRYSRAECDAVFLEALEARGVPKAERYAIYSGVRAFGWSHWSTRKATLGLNAQDFVPPGYFTASAR